MAQERVQGPLLAMNLDGQATAGGPKATVRFEAGTATEYEDRTWNAKMQATPRTATWSTRYAAVAAELRRPQRQAGQPAADASGTDACEPPPKFRPRWGQGPRAIDVKDAGRVPAELVSQHSRAATGQ